MFYNTSAQSLARARSICGRQIVCNKCRVQNTNFAFLGTETMTQPIEPHKNSLLAVHPKFTFVKCGQSR